MTTDDVLRLFTEVVDAERTRIREKRRKALGADCGVEARALADQLTLIGNMEDAFVRRMMAPTESLPIGTLSDEQRALIQQVKERDE